MKNGITDTVVTIGQPRHVDITGDRAYVVVPAGYSFTRNHRTVRETGSIRTFAMRKSTGIAVLPHGPGRKTDTISAGVRAALSTNHAQRQYADS